MHTLILTPDGVGSTILQRLVTMALYLEKVPVVNTHELTNGLVLKNHIVKKDFALGYTQTIDRIIDILNQSAKDVRVVSRVAKYHLDTRKDSPSDQEKFFSFINNFYQNKVMCVRENIFEYAMSWSIRKESRVLNVYTRHDRKAVMEVSEVDESYFQKKCQDYVDYKNWIERYFPDVVKVSYEKLMTDSDVVIEQLTGYVNTFKNKFDMSLSSILISEYKFSNSLTQNNTQHTLTREEQRSLFLYKTTSNSMIKQEIIVSNPIKNTTLQDKKNQIRNFDRCLHKFYSFAKNYNWIDQSNATYDFWNKKHIC